MKYILILILFVFSVRVQAQDVYATVEQMPEFPGGQAAMNKYISENLKYPKDAIDSNITGRVVAKFVVDETGKLTNIEIKRGLSASCNKAVIDLLNGMPKWIAGKQNGENKKVVMYLPISFSLSDNESTDNNASFPGGEKAMENFIKSNMKYPKSAKKNKIQGVTAIKFNIAADGTISNPKLVNSLGHGLDEEAMRIFNLMPKKWKPAKNENGTAINSEFTMPIEFKL